MQYVTGQHALNIPCSLLTCGDWHQSALQWKWLSLRDSDDSIFGEYGIEHNITIPEHSEKYNVANHIRALVTNHHFKWWFEFGPPKGLYYLHA